MNPLRLEQMTMFEIAPETMIDIAEALDVPMVSVFLVEGMPGARPVTHANKAPLLARLRDSSVRVDAAEVFMLGAWPGLPESEMALAAELGCGAITALDILPADDAQAADQLAALCLLAESYGLTVALEPISMGRTRTVADGLRLLQAAGAPANAKLTLDLLHVVRTGTPLADLAGLDRSLIASAQVCDGPALPPPDIVAEASFERGIPGTGDFPVAAFLELLPADVTVGLEVPLASLRDAGLSAMERSRRVVEATRRYG
jgi:sugar phosphate isomerase/epimerase